MRTGLLRRQKATEVELLGKSIKPRGRIFMDYLAFDQDEAHEAIVGDEQNTVSFDTVRLGFEGDVWEFMSYTVEMEFEGNEVDFKDAFIMQKELAYIDTVRVGHQRENFGLDRTPARGSSRSWNAASPTKRRSFPGRNTVRVRVAATCSTTNTSPSGRRICDERPGRSAGRRLGLGLWAWTDRAVLVPYYSECHEYQGRYMMHAVPARATA